MGKAHPIELRARVAAFVDEGHGHREAARHFRVSPKFVNDLIKLRCESGSLLGTASWHRWAIGSRRVSRPRVRSRLMKWLASWRMFMASPFIAVACGGSCVGSG